MNNTKPHPLNPASILITGGAGYIGSHVAKQLLATTKHNIVVLDNLSTGSIKTIKILRTIRDFRFIHQDLNEFDKVDEILKENEIETIIHFAASIVVPESVEKPMKYYINNTANTINLIDKSIKNSVKKFIFSSTAAVYGEPDAQELNTQNSKLKITESFKTQPINPYGMSKLMNEKIIIDAAEAHKDFKYVIFRYFNVAGADIHPSPITNHQSLFTELKPRIGQSFPNATHLIKIASECATGKRDKMYIFGDDYPTKDGTGVRDYIHVDDLADAHIRAINYLENNDSDIFNAGYGRGYSVKEVVQTMKNVTQKGFEVETAQRRAGDPASLIADNTKITEKMRWKPKYDNLKLICKSAYEWEKSI